MWGCGFVRDFHSHSQNESSWRSFACKSSNNPYERKKNEKKEAVNYRKLFSLF